ncbi:VOC family protein [Streptomyces sp. YIM 98790]|uniref:VOC family protein n=1 Tax=Streptomyces sp. YIM 98790 TaxID=2689077 RepID=UPI00140E9307|nr:VOC family protein [Streptomyces sp. YIM 98790]
MTESWNPPGPGAPCWVSLLVHDLPAAEHFYRELFGWEYHAGPEQLSPYSRALHHGHPVAGLAGRAARLGRPVTWLPYIATGDADATCDMIRECGGTLAIGPMDVEHSGRMAIASDTVGAVFGVFQPGEHPGCPFAAMPGVPVWMELITSESSAVSKFYAVVFDYDPRPESRLPSLDYLTLYHSGRPVAGIHGVGPRSVPHDRGSHWLVYFSVSDLDRVTERVTELGGRLAGEVRPTPFGRMARMTDPEGTPFAVLEETP